MSEQNLWGIILIMAVVIVSGAWYWIRSEIDLNKKLEAEKAACDQVRKDCLKSQSAQIDTINRTNKEMFYMDQENRKLNKQLMESLDLLRQYQEQAESKGNTVIENNELSKKVDDFTNKVLEGVK